MDCLHWVNRDSYLPQGSRGLKVLLNRFTQPHESSQLMGLLPRAAPLLSNADQHTGLHEWESTCYVPCLFICQADAVL